MRETLAAETAMKAKAAGWCAAGAIALAALAGCGSSESPNAAGAKTCAAQPHWVSAWQAPPTDGVMPGDSSLNPFLAGPSQTFRAILTPLGAGAAVRVHLSNRFGQLPLTVNAVTVAHRTSGAAIDPATSVPVLFSGNAGVTIPPGQDVVSDAVAFTLHSFDDFAVSVFAADANQVHTQHSTARQHSYATLPLVGDHSADASGAMFTQPLTLRPYVVGLDVLAPASTSALVTFGDSLTDGFQGPPSLLPEDPATLDLNQRYPDFLRRRLEVAGRGELFVSNAGISGNRVLADGQIPSFGPRAVDRVEPDVLQQAGVTDVVLWEGINDIGQTSGLTAEQLINGYIDLISRMHARGIRVLQGTLTPAGGDVNSGYSGANAMALRAAVNDWIRTQSPADAIVDFDAAVRDPAKPDSIDPQYDGGDGLHFNAAGYARLADAIDLSGFAGAGCR